VHEDKLDSQYRAIYPNFKGLLKVKEAGHWLHWEQPAEMAGLLGQVLF
jgi:pimeloyl-ACP methyl ester carboxylesterase